MKNIRNLLQNQNLPLPTKSLFLEGMRQLRIGGLLYAALCVVDSLGCNVDVYRHSDAMQRRYTLSSNISGRFDDNLMFLLLLSGIFLTAASFRIMSFLRSPRARDFYLAAPRSSGRLWAGFASAVLGWHGIAMGGSFLVWLLFSMPYDFKSVGVCLAVLGSLLASTFLIFALVMLALSLTGRLLTALVTLAGLGLSLPAFFSVYNMGAREYESFYFYQGRPVCPDIITFCVGRYMLNLDCWRSEDLDFYRVLTSGATAAFSLAAGLLLTGLAAYFASVRTGNAAGQPFVNKTAHAISLTAVSLPVTCVLAALVYAVYFDTGFDVRTPGTADDILSCCVAGCFAAVGFWLSELLLTFRVRQSGRVLPLFALPLVIAAATVTMGHWAAYRDITFTPSADEVASFTLVRNGSLPKKLAIFRMKDTYGRTVTDGWAFTDRATIAFLTETNNQLAEEVKQSPLDRGNWSREEDAYASLVRVRLNLKNGRTLIRCLKLGDQDIDALQKVMLSDAAFKETFLALPDPEKVNIDIQTGGITSDEAQDIYRSLTEEFRLLPEEEKLQFISENIFQSYTWKYGYSDPGTDAVSGTDLPETGTAPEQTGEIQWDNTYAVLQSRSANPGDYVVTSSSVDKPRREDFMLTVHLEGYGEGGLYCPDAYYCFGLHVSGERFPATARRIVSVCNGKADLIAKAAQSYDSDLNAQYYGAVCTSNVQYSLISPRNADAYKVDLKEYTSGQYGKNATVLRCNVDANALVHTLLTDVKATGEIDFTRPYAKIRIFLPGSSRASTYWAQTENPVDALLSSDAEQSGDEASNRKE